MTLFITLVLTSFLARFGYQMARSPVLPRFAQDLGAAPEMLGLIVAASTITGVVIKLPAGALSDVLGRKRMMLLGCLFFAGPPFLYPLHGGLWHDLGHRGGVRTDPGWCADRLSQLRPGVRPDCGAHGRGGPHLCGLRQGSADGL
jgi:MFS family permease